MTALYQEPFSYLAERFFENQFSQPLPHAWRDENGGGIRRKSEPDGQGPNGKIDAILTEIVWVFKRH